MVRRQEHFTPKKLTFGSVTLDVNGQELVAENSVRLAGMEASLMEFFMLNPEKTFTTEEIYTHVWKEQDAGPDIVWVYISYLRNKLMAIASDVKITGEQGGSFMLTLSK